MAERVLVVEGSAASRDASRPTMIAAPLVESGYAVTTVALDGWSLRTALEREEVDLVVLGIDVPDRVGIQLFRELLASWVGPVMVVTPFDDVIERVVILEMGADDCLSRPFDVRELLARVRSVLRRARGARVGCPPFDAPDWSRGQFGEWVVDLRHRSLSGVDGQPVRLTAAEFDLLVVLARHEGRVLSRDLLSALLHGREMSPFERGVDTLVARLRRAIEPDPHTPVYIRTVRGAGYVFTSEVNWS